MCLNYPVSSSRLCSDLGLWFSCWYRQQLCCRLCFASPVPVAGSEGGSRGEGNHSLRWRMLLCLTDGKELLINSVRRVGILFPFDSFLVPHPRLFMLFLSPVNPWWNRNWADIYSLEQLGGFLLENHFSSMSCQSKFSLHSGCINMLSAGCSHELRSLHFLRLWFFWHRGLYEF